MSKGRILPVRSLALLWLVTAFVVGQIPSLLQPARSLNWHLSSVQAGPQIRVTKLSGTMPDFGSVGSFRISPDGLHAIYRADQEIDERYDFYSVALAGTVPVRIAQGLEDSAQPMISPDGRIVVYDKISESGQALLFSVPISGPETAAISLGVASDLGLVVYRISGDSTWVVYQKPVSPDMHNELYSVPIRGPASATVQLGGPATIPGNVGSFAISPDGAWVIFSNRLPGQDELTELYSVPIGGPATSAIRLNQALPPDRLKITSFAISPDSQRVVWRAMGDGSIMDDLYSAPIAGPATATVRLTGLFPSEVLIGDFAISPDSGRAVYKVDPAQGGYLTGFSELFSVPIVGPESATVVLKEQGQSGDDINRFLLDSSAHHVVFDLNSSRDLYSVPTNGPAGAAVRLNDLPSAGSRFVPRFMLTSSSQHVVYSFQISSPFWQVNVYSVPIVGPATAGVKLGSVEWSDFAPSPDGRWVAYKHTDGRVLLIVSIEGPANSSTQLNPPLVDGGSLGAFEFAFGGLRVIYAADQEVPGRRELYLADASELIPSPSTPTPTSTLTSTAMPTDLSTFTPTTTPTPSETPAPTPTTTPTATVTATPSETPSPSGSWKQFRLPLILLGQGGTGREGPE